MILGNDLGCADLEKYFDVNKKAAVYPAVSASLLGCDLARLADEIVSVTAAGSEWLHFDVMDGSFVPNISYGIPVIEACSKTDTAAVFDVHLMIDKPEKYIKDFVRAGADIITFHYESQTNIRNCIDLIHSYGKKAGVSVKPNTPAENLLPFADFMDMVLVMSVEPGFGGQKFIPEALEKIEYLAEKFREAGRYIPIAVDGGIDAETGKKCREKGADILIAGSYIFKASDRKTAIDSLLAGKPPRAGHARNE